MLCKRFTEVMPEQTPKRVKRHVLVLLQRTPAGRRWLTRSCSGRRRRRWPTCAATRPWPNNSSPAVACPRSYSSLTHPTEKSRHAPNLPDQSCDHAGTARVNTEPIEIPCPRLTVSCLDQGKSQQGVGFWQPSDAACLHSHLASWQEILCSNVDEIMQRQPIF